MAEKGILLRRRHAGWSPLEVKGSTTEAGTQDGTRRKAEGSLCQHSPLLVVLNAIATPLASLPVARVPEGLGGLRGTVKDTKSMPKASLKIALVYLVSAIPGEIRQQLAPPRGAQSRGCPSPLLFPAGQRSLTHRCHSHTCCLPSSGTCNSQTCPQRPGAPGRCQS